jgi:Holliday junction resolvase RusA-like endonuclease
MIEPELRLNDWPNRWTPVRLPAPKPYERAARNGRRTYTSTEERAWRYAAGLALAAMRPSRPLEGPIVARVIAVYPRPARRPLRVGAEEWATGRRVLVPSARSDLDNITKLVNDTVTEVGGWWADDREVAVGLQLAYYAAVGEAALVEFRALEVRGDTREVLIRLVEAVI